MVAERGEHRMEVGGRRGRRRRLLLVGRRLPVGRWWAGGQRPGPGRRRAGRGPGGLRGPVEPVQVLQLRGHVLLGARGDGLLLVRQPVLGLADALAPQKAQGRGRCLGRVLGRRGVHVLGVVTHSLRRVAAQVPLVRIGGERLQGCAVVEQARPQVRHQWRALGPKQAGEGDGRWRKRWWRWRGAVGRSRGRSGGGGVGGGVGGGELEGRRPHPLRPVQEVREVVQCRIRAVGLQPGGHEHRHPRQGAVRREPARQDRPVEVLFDRHGHHPWGWGAYASQYSRQDGSSGTHMRKSGSQGAPEKLRSSSSVTDLLKKAIRTLTVSVPLP